jgi:hypothetical protein
VSIEAPDNPLAFICVTLLPVPEGDEGGERNCPEGAVPVEIPGDPLVFACVVLVPDASGESPDDDGLPVPELPTSGGLATTSL